MDKSALTLWLENIGLEEYVPVFQENKLDVDILSELSEQDLKELEIPLGHRKRILRAIRESYPESPEGNQQGEAVKSPVAPAHFAERAMRAKSSMEGERKQVTILFADIKGSTEFVELMEAEDVEKLLRLAVEGMMNSIHRYEGTVNKVLGDGVMAIFGAPLAHEDHATRACFAALAMHSDMRLVADEARRKFGVEVQLRIGLNSGDVVVRTIHNDLTMDYDAIGATVHLASRMEQMARPGTTRITTNTRNLAEGFIETKDLGLVPVKGVSDPMDVFELLSAVDIRSRFQATIGRGLSRFVGRDDEIELLDNSLKKAQSGEGQIFSVVGEAGVGKSRLFYEFIRSPVTKDWLVLESGSVSHSSASAFQPIIDMLRNYFSLSRSDEERTIRERVMGKILTMDESLQQLTTPLLALFNVDNSDDSWAQLDPAVRRKQTLEACRALLVNEAQIQPLVVVFEDLHWIDRETQAFLDLIVDSVGRLPILLLLNYRPEYEDNWPNKSYFTRIRIAPLAQQSGHDLLDDLLGPNPDISPLKETILQRTEGNPFFIEESVRGLVENQVLTGERGNYSLAIPVRSISVPASVQTVLAARIDRLEPEQKRLLQTAAVIGKDFGMKLLHQVSECSESEVRQWLEALQSAEFLFETRLFPDPEYTFNHALTHQVAYEGMLHERRRELHVSILEALEKLSTNRNTDELEKLAYHAMRGETWDKAFQFAFDAGDAAVAMNANRSALESFEVAREALDRLPETDENRELAIELRFRIRDVLFMQGEHKHIIELMDEAEEIAAQIHNQSLLVEVLLYKSGYYWSYGEQRAHSLPLAEQAYELAESMDDNKLIGMSSYRVVTSHILLGEYKESIPWAEKGLSALKSEADTFHRFGGLLYAFIGSFKTIALAELGELDEADQIGRIAWESALKSDHAYTLTVAGFGLLHSLLLQEKADECQEIISICLEKSSVHGVIAATPWIAGRAVYAFSVLGDRENAETNLKIIEESEKLSQSMRHGGLAYTWAARGCLALGDIERAKELASKNPYSTEGDPDLGAQAWCHWVLGEVARLEDRLENASSSYKIAMDIANDREMRSLQCYCLESLGIMETCASNTGEAQKWDEKAANLSRAIGHQAMMERLSG